MWFIIVFCYQVIAATNRVDTLDPALLRSGDVHYMYTGVNFLSYLLNSEQFLCLLIT